jgi:hypothetical protein
MVWYKNYETGDSLHIVIALVIDKQKMGAI